MGRDIRIALAGFGLVGRQHASALGRCQGVSLAAIVEPDPAGRDAAAALGLPVVGALADLDGVDGVVLATPTPLHLEHGLAAIARGWPVLVEKPITVTSAEALELVTAAERAGVPILVGHHRRHNGRIAAAKAALDRGEIGDVRAVQATCWLHKPDDYFAAAPWRTRKGAGPISVNLVHDVDLLRYFCGEVLAVQAVAAPARRGFENEDLATALLEFASGVIASISVSDSIAAPWSWELTARENPVYPATSESCYLIGGSEGSLSLPDLRVWRHRDRPDWWQPIGATSLVAAEVNPLEQQVMHFAEVIRGDAVPLVSGREGLRSLAVVEAVAEAARTGGRVELAGH